MIKITVNIIIFILISLTTRADITTRSGQTIKELVNRILSDKKYCKKLKIREPLLLSEFYEENNYKPQWYSGKDDILKRENLHNSIISNKFLIDINDYSSIIIIKKKCSTKHDSLVNEIRMTDLALYFFKDVAFSHQNFVKYNRTNYFPDCLNFPWFLQESLETGDFEKYLLACEPGSEQYQQLKIMYLKLYDSVYGSNHPGARGTKYKIVNQQLNKIRYAANFYRWLSCIQYKSCIVMNLASQSISYMECDRETFISAITPVNISGKDFTQTSVFTDIVFYYDGTYPYNLQFDFKNPFDLVLRSLKGTNNITAQHYIGIENPEKLAGLLEIEKGIIQNKVCLDEATPFIKIPARPIHLFIVNVPMDF